MKQLGLGIIVALGLTLPAIANPPQLEGDYAFTYNDTCLQSTSGFNPTNLTPLAGPVNLTSTGATGFEHFNGDGTGTVEIINQTEITLASTPLGSSASNLAPVASFQFTYAFNPDGSFTMTVVPGTFIGNVFRLDPGFAWLGFVSNDAKSHTLTAIPPLLQTVTINGSPPTKVFQVCRSNVIGIALNPAN